MWQWFVESCNDEYNVACQIDLGSVNCTWKSRIKSLIGLTCPTGWTRHNGKCYEFFVNGEYRRSWKDAVHFCSEIGAQILEIKSEEEQAYISLHNARLAKGICCKNFKISSLKFDELKILWRLESWSARFLDWGLEWTRRQWMAAMVWWI